MFIISEFLSDRRRIGLNGKVSETVAVSRVPQSSILGPLLLMCSSQLFYIVGNHIVSHADDTRPLSRPKVMEWLNQDLAANDEIAELGFGLLVFAVAHEAQP